jgi:hypothetical protein
LDVRLVPIADMTGRICDVRYSTDIQAPRSPGGTAYGCTPTVSTTDRRAQARRRQVDARGPSRPAWTLRAIGSATEDGKNSISRAARFHRAQFSPQTSRCRIFFVCPAHGADVPRPIGHCHWLLAALSCGMIWGQISVLVAVACFAAIALFMMRRTPHA